MIEESAGTKDFAVIYTVWNLISEFVITGTECGRKGAHAEVIIGTAVYELYGSYRRLALLVCEKLQQVFAPVLEEGDGTITCEKLSHGVSLRFEIG